MLLYSYICILGENDTNSAPKHKKYHRKSIERIRKFIVPVYNVTLKSFNVCHGYCLGFWCLFLCEMQKYKTKRVCVCLVISSLVRSFSFEMLCLTQHLLAIWQFVRLSVSSHRLHRSRTFGITITIIIIIRFTVKMRRTHFGTCLFSTLNMLLPLQYTSLLLLLLAALARFSFMFAYIYSFSFLLFSLSLFFTHDVIR